MIALPLIGALFACVAVQNNNPDAKSAQESEPAKVADPMAGFARLIGGEWQLTLTSGTTHYHAWQWGPGKHSMRKVTDGSDALGSWGGELMYWHPGRQQVCVLSLHGDIPGVGRGVCEGTIKFDGESADGVFDLYQPRGLRKLGSRWIFDGPDKYHDTLLEDSGAGLEPMNAWDFFRIKERFEGQPHTAEEAPPKLSKHLEFFEALLGHTWEVRGESATGDAFHIQSTYERAPSLEVICARAIALSRNDEPTHLLDAYFYHHIGTDSVRCLALSSRGGVYEGDVTVLEGSALQVDLKSYEGDRVVPHVVRFDFEKDGTLRHRVWSLNGAERTLTLEVHHKKLEPMEE